MRKRDKFFDKVAKNVATNLAKRSITQQIRQGLGIEDPIQPMIELIDRRGTDHCFPICRNRAEATLNQTQQ